ncbi:hypothetical protein AKJ16_DCAP25199 [Drosera capensis]
MTKSLRRVSQTSQNLKCQFGGSMASVPSPVMNCIEKGIIEGIRTREVEELINIKECNPTALILRSQSTMGESRFLRLNPQPYMPGNIVVFLIKLFDHIFQVIITVIVVDEPSFHSEPSMVHYPFPDGRSLVPYHGARTKLVTSPVNPSSHTDRNLDSLNLPDVHPHILGQCTPDDLLSSCDCLRGTHLALTHVHSSPLESTSKLIRVGFPVGSKIQSLHKQYNRFLPIHHSLISHHIPLIHPSTPIDTRRHIVPSPPQANNRRVIPGWHGTPDNPSELIVPISRQGGTDIKFLVHSSVHTGFIQLPMI